MNTVEVCPGIISVKLYLIHNKEDVNLLKRLAYALLSGRHD